MTLSIRPPGSCPGRTRVLASSVLLALLPAGVAGCALAARPAAVEPAIAAEPPTGVVHVVERGQTLWRIARAYGVSVDELAARNSIQDPTRIEVGQRLVVPGASTPVAVPLAPEPTTVVARFSWPVSGEILSRFGDPRGRRRHRGLDIRGRGGEPVRAAADGRVIESGDRGRGYGKLVVIDHGDGLETRYAHGRKLLVRAGDRVSRGDAIALVGRTGNATTEHCHFEVRRHRVPVDPLPYLSRPSGSTP